MKEELNILIQAQYPLIYLVTSEEERPRHNRSDQTPASYICLHTELLNMPTPECYTAQHCISSGDRVDNPAARAESFYP